jgi:hypothetical protein
MAWTVEIHVIDVGAGDSSLIIAEEPLANHLSSMLVDGGLTSSARLVHNKVLATGLPELDAILVSHYDIDHSIGVAALLLSDNLWHLCDIIAQIAVTFIPAAGTPREQVVARAAAQATAAALGANAAAANPFGLAAAVAVPAGANDLAAATFGVNQLAGFAGAFAGPRLIPGAPSRGNAAREAAYAARASIAAGSPLGTVQADTRTALFDALQTSIPVGARFETDGIYLDTRVIDIGNAAQPAQSYNLAINGGVSFSGTVVWVPGINRQLIRIPPLGSDVLWPGAPPTQDAPVAIVVSTPLNWIGATTGTGWQGANPPHAPVAFQGGTLGNCASIGVVLVFEDFAHFTAGDLPSQGEDPIGDALMAESLPDGSGNEFALLDRIVNLKCSHHGAAASTSDHFVTTITPRTAVISCGAKHNHPTQRVVDTLHNNVPRFWLTNCSYPRVNVPFSTGGNQLLTPGNRAMVAGDNVLPNTAAGRNRGDITITILEGEATGAVGARQYHVQYWEDSSVPPGPRGLTIQW